MAVNLSVTELKGHVDSDGRLCVDELIPMRGPVPVRVWVVIENGDDIAGPEWLAAIARSPALSDLADPAEDLYTLEDGKPL